MRVAIYGRQFNNSVVPFLQQIFDALAARNIETVIPACSLGRGGSLLPAYRKREVAKGVKKFFNPENNPIAS